MPKISDLPAISVPLDGHEQIPVAVTPDAADGTRGATVADVKTYVDTAGDYATNDALGDEASIREADDLTEVGLRAAADADLQSQIDALELSGGVYTDEMARDAIGTALVEGNGIDITVDDVANTITVAATGVGLFDPAVRVLPITERHLDTQLQQTDNALMAGHCIFSYQYLGVWYQARLFVGWDGNATDESLHRHAYITRRTLPSGAWSTPVDLAQGGGDQRSDPFVMQYADPNLGRTVTDGQTYGTTTITSATANFVDSDVFAMVVGSADLPTNVRIKSVTNATTVVLETACTGSHTGQTFTILKGNASHPALALGVSKDGKVHVMGNVHNDPMNYVRTATANDYSTFEDHTSTSGTPILAGNWTPESSSSYPKFVRQGVGNDDLFMMFRDTNGGMTTNDSKWWCYKWDTTANGGNGGWVNPWPGKCLIDGHASTPVRGPYIMHPVADSQGRIHVFWMNKYETVADTGYENDDVRYLRIEADGVTVKKADGTTLTPGATGVVLSNGGDLVLNTADGTDVGLANYHATVDSNDEPHALTHFGADGATAVVRHYYHDGTGWHTPDLTQTMNPLWGFTGTQQCAPFGIGDKVYALMSKYGIRAFDITPGSPGYGVDTFLVSDAKLLAWMHGIDPTALQLRNKLVIGWNEVTGQGSATNPFENQRQRLNAIVEFDCAQFDKLASRTVGVPKVRVLSTSIFPKWDAEIRGTTSAASAWRGCEVAPSLYGDNAIPLMASMMVEGRVSAAGTTLVVEMWEQGATTPRLKLVIADSTTNVQRAVVWQPLTRLVQGGPTGALEVRAYVLGSGYGMIDAGKLQVNLGVLDEQLTSRGF